MHCHHHCTNYIVQHLGRLDRKWISAPGTNTYEIHIDYVYTVTYVSLLVLVIKHEIADEQRTQLESLHQVFKCVS